MQIVTGEPVAILFAAANDESPKIGFINGLVTREPYVAIDPEYAALRLQAAHDGIILYYVIYHRLNKMGKVLPGLIISGTIPGKPQAVIMSTEIMQETDC